MLLGSSRKSFFQEQALTPQGTLPAHGPTSGSSSSLHSRGMGKLLDAVEDFALHAVLDLTPPHHQLQHLVDGVFWVFLEKEKAGGDELAGESSTEPRSNLQPLLKLGCASPEGAPWHQAPGSSTLLLFQV